MSSEYLNIITNSVWSAIVKFMFLVYLIHQKPSKNKARMHETQAHLRSHIIVVATHYIQNTYM